MEFRDLKAQYAALKPQIDAGILSVIERGQFILGEEVQTLEARLSDYVGVRHCVTCANGTDALVLALTAMEISAGDAVFVPDFTFFASAEAIATVGATPVFVDVDPETFNLSPAALTAQIERVRAEGKWRPKAIVAVDLFGLPANYPAIRKIARQNDLRILEDGAQGFGGRIGAARACSFGDLSTTSFFPAKPLGCYGDGGAVFTDDDALAARLRSLRVHGKGADKYDNVRLGQNSRLDTMQAAVLLAKLDAFRSYELDAVNRAAAAYTERLAGVVQTPVVPDGFYSSWAQYTIRLPDAATRAQVQAALKRAGIPSMIYYARPIHKQGAFSPCPQDDADFRATDALCERVLSLPMHPYLQTADVDAVCTALRAALSATESGTAEKSHSCRTV